MTAPAERLTNAQFAKIAARLAKTCSAWAGDSLDLPEQWARPMDRTTLRRFLVEIRSGLDYLERLNVRS